MGIVCIKCHNEIVYHVYGDRCANPWRDFRTGDRIAPLCLKCYCVLTAEKILGCRCRSTTNANLPARQGEYVGELVIAIMRATGMEAFELGALLDIHPKVIGRWKLNRRKPLRENVEKLKAFAKQRGIVV